MAAALRHQLFRLYMAMFLILARWILRPVAFKYRSKRPDLGWRAMWDRALFIGGFCAGAAVRRGGRERASGRAVPPDPDLDAGL